MGETQGQTSTQQESANAGSGNTQQESADAGGSKSKAAAVAAGTGAAVAGVAGGIAVAARDTRRRLLGIPIGKRSRFQRGASVVADTAGTVVEKVREPVKAVGSRFSRDA